MKSVLSSALRAMPVATIPLANTPKVLPLSPLAQTPERSLTKTRKPRLPRTLATICVGKVL